MKTEIDCGTDSKTNISAIVKTKNSVIDLIRNVAELLSDKCRLRKNDFVKHVLHTCAALHNFRVKLNPFRY
jgi:hypothetical protein